MPSRAWKRAGVAGVVVVATATGGFALLRGSDGAAPPAAERRGQSGRATPSDAELVEFRHDQAAFAISYPEGWTRAQSSDPQVAFVAAEHAPAENRGGSILVRTAPLDVAVGPEQLAEARASTDALVAAGNGIELKAEPTEIEQGGLPGLHYFYTFLDPLSGRRGAHSHYFLFRDTTMISLVFQGLPEADFVRLAPLFDRVAATFRLLETSP